MTGYLCAPKGAERPWHLQPFFESDRGTRQIVMENPDDLHDFPPDHPARLLMIAQERLSSCPAAANGTKSVVAAACGDYVVRLTAFVPGMITNGVSPLWVELYHTSTERALDAAGCNDLAEAIAAAEELLAEAKSLNARGGQSGTQP